MWVGRTAGGIFILSCLIGMAFPVANLASGDIVWRTGLNKPLYGKIQRNDESQITLVVWNDLGETTQVLNLPKNEVRAIFRSVTQEKLEALDPSSPTDYPALAETLEYSRQDPYARNLARRLYLIAATLSPELKIDCLKAVYELSTDTAEKQRIRTFLLMNSETISETLSASIKDSKAMSADNLKLLLDVVRFVRQEKRGQAQKLLEGNSTELISQWPDSVERSVLQQSLVNETSSDKFAALVGMEVTIRRKLGGTKTRNQLSEPNWSESAFLPPVELTELPSLKNLTRHDPHQSIYRNGVWQRPDDLTDQVN
ncbi:MAG: hypothetical protein AAF939_20020 [Planctomycetota bacterium]